MIHYISLIGLELAGIAFAVLMLFTNVNETWNVALSLNFVLILPVKILLSQMLQEPSPKSLKSFWGNFFSVKTVLILLQLFATIFVLISGTFNYSDDQNIIYCTSQFSTFILGLHILILAYALFMLENVYRYAHLYQRRLGRVSFVGALLLICHQIIISSRWLLYGWVPVSWFQYAAYTYSFSLLAILWSFAKYRMNNEKIKVTRDAVYSSFSLLLIGTAFTALGITFTILKNFDITLSPFDFKVIVLSILFAGTILAGSARMRRRVAKLINRRFYSTKYDYREQFFSLHRILGRVEGYKETLEELMEHLRKSLNLEHAYLFIINEQSGNYDLLAPKERDLPRALTIKSSSPIIKTIREKGDYFGLLTLKNDSPMEIYTDDQVSVEKLGITDVAPVLHYDSLFAILTLKWVRTENYKTEDVALIEAYTSVIADFLFRNRILKERLEQKQFESFSHMASFIVHDVKNQVATLKLLVRNAQTNISNPEFQKSLLLSLQNCTTNLDKLVSKLSMPPKADKLKKSRIDIGAVVKKLIDDSGLKELPGVELETNIGSNLFAEADEGAIYYTIKNLFVNALESMGNQQGNLKINAFLTSESKEKLLTRFPGTESLFSSYSVAVCVEDSGCGMSEDFLKHHLFKPFSTTKDKGIGIGLYQCKTLVEQMGGKVICESQVGRGTLFCILL
ncbi:MAG: ATP-binding protein [Fibrobacter sp.]|nr:ATP-binding protein [Fibrobacter sp.]